MSQALRPAHDQRFSDLIRSRTGIQLPVHRRQMIESRLRPRIAAVGATGFEGYLEQLFDHGLLDDELPLVIDLLTTNKTDFYRESAHFDVLVDKIVPETIRHATPHAPRLKIWSAASSEGAEAYTAAIVLSEAQRAGHRFSYAILGTDISHRMLERARRAIYTAEQLSPVPAELRARYTMAGRAPSHAGTARIVPELRDRVQFMHLNLMDSTYPVDRDVDVIFLRNVLIYFGPEDQAAVIARMAGHLRPGGYLMVGHSESMVVSHPQMKQHSPSVFRKT
ncbi:methyltransferase domain-containing protein [Rhodobacter sphaeroides]|jgi:Methylase of chemotaxis methyl-accepting proteins|uniref:Chemotaxis protein methyltransferase n=1 Tax=Cereibacter sphaeroides (strain ATCC 17023 / DSM 158 / JCM 6121 / CCUG 31486 / LMG 2827 / NBRC 12203 / NCIMB 8253 / ATH 2.4.1.) TaxID=272943 RepID=Q3J654_CERS4|nr:protein-glutamate O-methyltransferase [Cereibacter sphaeroides]ABA77730.1 Chemotaxis methyltransferase, CheR2 [Cereibacter sphaeroides 2.4.1]AMJ46130.1 chemotaxis protein CheR [Cereibacter sphaeroides]ANS32842.1 chemotaxis protein CheR [Cereibacter sphaeroides]ATN61894.1 chemotaxis protein CheR [Cereibacter sphaeroides]AXC59976.1 methyltransferase domain-containing protein [Cereibacter sphaeroides 2.4.1]